jgi:hypothetical protein
MLLIEKAAAGTDARTTFLYAFLSSSVHRINTSLAWTLL